MFNFLIVLGFGSYRESLSSNLSLVLPNDSTALVLLLYFVLQCCTVCPYLCLPRILSWVFTVLFIGFDLDDTIKDIS